MTQIFNTTYLIVARLIICTFLSFRFSNPRISCHSKVLPEIDLEKWRDSIETVRNPIIHLFGSEAEPFLRGSRTADAETLKLNDTKSPES